MCTSNNDNNNNNNNADIYETQACVLLVKGQSLFLSICSFLTFL